MSYVGHLWTRTQSKTFTVAIAGNGQKAAGFSQAQLWSPGKWKLLRALIQGYNLMWNVPEWTPKSFLCFSWVSFFKLTFIPYYSNTDTLIGVLSVAGELNVFSILLLFLLSHHCALIKFSRHNFCLFLTYCLSHWGSPASAWAEQKKKNTTVRDMIMKKHVPDYL